ncbi:MAG: DMT family transporter [Pseudanabaenaceae cyanobacterium bins.68]|nr:DMT family transporter [Pseudanabaenaceae cyanobacterium bins.68]
MPEPNRQSWFVILPFCFWGTAMVVMKAVIPQVSPLTLAALRLLPAGILLLLAAKLWGRSFPQGWRPWLWICLFALVDGTMFQGFLCLGLTHTGAGLGSLLIDSQPLAVAVLASWFYGEAIGTVAIAGLLLGVVGIGLVGLPPQFWQPGFDLWQKGLFGTGEWLMLAASLSMAFGTILIRPVVRHADPLVATGWHMVLGSIPLLVLGSIYEPWQSLDVWSWLGLGYVSIFGSAIAYGLFFWFAASGNLTTLSALTFSTPIFALLFSGLTLHESLRGVQWLGVALTLCSIYLVSAKPVKGAKLIEEKINSV